MISNRGGSVLGSLSPDSKKTTELESTKLDSLNCPSAV